MKFLKALLVQSLFAVIFFLSASAQSDTSVLNRIMTKTAKVYTDYPVEKVYLHFDKPYYAVGDTIWFKAYLTIYQHQPSPLSKIIYVDVLSSKDSLIQSLKLQVKNGEAWSSIPLLQANYKKGNYRIMAYTNWMNNGDIGYFFNKNVAIGDAVNNKVATQISLKSTIVNKVPKVTAGIYYTDADGNPYAEKKVTWTVERDFEDIGKGKGSTDKNGFIPIGFLNTKNLTLDSATLITVIDNGDRKQTTVTIPLKSVSKPNDLQFFAEGGNLITGLPAKVAFKAIKPTGAGIDVKGNLTDNTGKVVVEFASSHLGMGVFYFTPEEGKTYKANIIFADGTTASPNLPKIESNSINLSVDNSDADALKLRIQCDPAFLKDNQGRTFYILAKSDGIIVYGAKTQLQNQVYNSTIPKSKFPTGIVQVTLFAEDGEPIAERIAFVQHNDQLNIAVNGDHPTYTTRQKVKLNISAKAGGQPDEGNFSIAVVDESKVPYDEDAEITILTNLLLTSDIKGYIEKPNYYFNHQDEKKLADLDILLQTQGYRRYSYDNTLNNKLPVVNFAPEQGITITGTLRASNGMAVNKGNMRLLIHDKNYSENGVTNEDGRFRFVNQVFLDSTKINLSARNNVRSNDLVVTVDGDPAQRLPTNYNKADEILNIDSTLSSIIKNSKTQLANSHVLKEVVIKDTRIVPKVSHKDYPALSSLSSEPDHLVNGDQFQGCNNVLECLKTLAMGMTFADDNFYVLRDYSQGKKVPAQVFVKGMPVDVNYLANMNAGDIESVEIFVKDELGLVNSANQSNGAIVVNLKKIETTKISLQELKSLLPQRNDITFTPQGYAIVRTFYLPRYIGPRASQPGALDNRTTIYWNPNVSTDKTGNASVEYFNSDGRGSYRAIIEGFDKDGNIGRQVFRYTVN